MIHQNVSIIKVLMLFYLIILNNYTQDLISGQLKDFITHNRLAQHAIAFTTLLVLINLFTDVKNIYDCGLYALLIYILFILTTKLDIKWNMCLFVILFVSYFNETDLTFNEKRISNDKNVPENRTKEIIQVNDLIKLGFVLLVILVTMLGSSQYCDKKLVQYGGGFDPLKYLLDAPENYKCCSKYTNTCMV